MIKIEIPYKFPSLNDYTKNAEVINLQVQQ